MIHSKPSGDDHGRSCPCKRLPMCLSSFTAAALGDVAALKFRQSKQGNRRTTDSAGNTPLHLAAQHGHVAATALLLQEEDYRSEINAGSATPLHRASFSGAVASMRLLMSVPNCNLLARDVSFADFMTPLHKAASGGRPLAVQLLIVELEKRKQLQSALVLTDSLGHTALQTAVERQKSADSEARCVARWNSVAGGLPDWNKCVQLLQRAERLCGTSNHDHGSTTSLASTTAALPSTPDHLEPSSFSWSEGAAGSVRSLLCLNCKDGDGNCRTRSWEHAFSRALSLSISSTLSFKSAAESSPPLASVTGASTPTLADGDVGMSDGLTGSERETEGSEDTSDAIRTVDGPKSALGSTLSSNQRLGRKCDACHERCLVIYPQGKLLVCRSCNKPCRRPNRRTHQL